MTDLPSIQDIVDEELACDHTVTRIRYKTDSLGRRLYVRQCIGCGAQVGDSIKHSEVAGRVDPFDMELYDGFERLRRTKYRQIATQREQAGREERREEYDAYLKSEEWEWRRMAVMARDQYKCKARYPGCLGRATITHHLSYDHFGNEPLFELVAICSKCNKILHPQYE